MILPMHGIDQMNLYISSSSLHKSSIGRINTWSSKISRTVVSRTSERGSGRGEEVEESLLNLSVVVEMGVKRILPFLI